MTIWILVGLGLFGCSKDEETTPSLTIDEAAEQIGASISTDIYGTSDDLVSISISSEASANGRVDMCGVGKDTSFTKQYSGTYNSYALQSTYAYQLNCSNHIPDNIGVTFTLGITRTGTRTNATSNTQGSYEITGFEASSKSYVINGEINRTATLTLLYRNNSEVKTTSKLTVQNLALNKETQQITGGSASYSLFGIGENGSFNYTSTVTFNDDKTATIIIQGKTYSVNLVTGQLQS